MGDGKCQRRLTKGKPKMTQARRLESSLIAATSVVVLFVAACAGRPVPDPAGASASPARTSDAPAARTPPTCDDWGSRNYFRSASPQDVRDCLQAGADPNGPPGLHPLPPHVIAAGETPHPAVISILVAAGADVDARAWGGLTPLHEAAAETTHAGVVTALAEAGVDPNARDGDGVAPLHLAAVHNRNLEVVTALVAAGADPNIRGPSGNTPLHLAWSGNPSLSGGRTAVIRELLRLALTALRSTISAGSPTPPTAGTGIRRPSFWSHRPAAGGRRSCECTQRQWTHSPSHGGARRQPGFHGHLAGCCRTGRRPPTRGVKPR